MSLLYPRLTVADSQIRIQELTDAYTNGGLPAVTALAQFEHHNAAPVATGGHVASLAKIQSVRAEVMTALSRWFEKGSLRASEVSSYDAELGRALHTALSIVPADAAHDETWNFLSLLVLPDVTILRFPALHRDRLLGTQRNALRRAWIRHEVLGDLRGQGIKPLGEDELVGLFERTALSRNRELARRTAIFVMNYDGPNRMLWAREQYKRITLATGPRLLDVLDAEELDALIRDEP